MSATSGGCVFVCCEVDSLRRSAGCITEGQVYDRCTINENNRRLSRF
jgi:hypothetical protein